MSTLALLVVLLLVLVAILFAGGVAYLVHRHRSLNAPVTAALTTVAVLIAAVALVAGR